MSHRRRPGPASIAFIALILLSLQAPAAGRDLTLKPNRVTLSRGRTFELNLPESFAVRVAAQGLRRPRFMALSPDGRLFVTDMHNMADNERGAVYVLEGFDPAAGSFAKVAPYLTRLRNPNSLAFLKDADGSVWLYVALTDRLVRYRYEAGDEAPKHPPQTIATFPDYGLNYKYGGWHLTRTVLAGGDGRVYVSVGSSCNACVEKEAVRASVLVMEPDGKGRRAYAVGLRNAVGMKWVEGRLFVTNMGADHLGDHKPADTMYALEEGADYGWPYCFQSGRRVFADAKYNARGRRKPCRAVPRAYAAFDAHSSPLGLEYFGESAPAELSGSFLVAMHGSGKSSLGRGYSVVRVSAKGVAEDFLTGFRSAGKVRGRPVDVLSFGRGFLVTDDRAGAVYYVYKR